jgi:hypothetical protein
LALFIAANLSPSKDFISLLCRAFVSSMVHRTISDGDVCADGVGVCGGSTTGVSSSPMLLMMVQEREAQRVRVPSKLCPPKNKHFSHFRVMK